MAHRKQIIENVLKDMHVMRHKLMTGYHHKKTAVITPSQGFVLRFVAEHHSPNVKEIAHALHVTSSAATQLIECLVGKGYLVRKINPQDRRGVYLSLSPKAEKLFKSFKDESIKRMTELFTILTDEELAQYAELNKKIVTNIINVQ